MFEEEKIQNIKQNDTLPPDPVPIHPEISPPDPKNIQVPPFADLSLKPQKKRSKLPLIIGGVVILLGILGGGFYAYSKGYITIPFIAPNAEAAVAKMMKAMSGVESMAFNVDLSLAEKNEVGNDNWHLQTALTGKKETSSTGLTAALAINGTYSSSTDNMPFSGEFRMLNDKTYFRISEIPATLYELGNMKNKWYYLKSSDAAGNLGTLNPALNTNASDLTEEQYQQMKDLVSESTFIKANNVLEEQTVQGVECYHYDVILDAAGITLFIQKLAGIINQTITDQMITDLVDFPEGLNELKTEVWIGKSDHYLYQVKTNALKLNSNNKQVSTDLTIQLTEFNQPASIAVPEDAEELNMEELMGAMFLGSMNTEADFTTDTDNDGLLDLLEANYGCNPQNADTDGDGFKDGEEVENGYNPNGEGKLELSLLFNEEINK